MFSLGAERELLLVLIGFWFLNANKAHPCGDVFISNFDLHIFFFLPVTPR